VGSESAGHRFAGVEAAVIVVPASKARRHEIPFVDRSVLCSPDNRLLNITDARGRTIPSRIPMWVPVIKPYGDHSFAGCLPAVLTFQGDIPGVSELDDLCDTPPTCPVPVFSPAH